MSTKKDLKLAIMAGEKNTNLLVAAAKVGDTAEVLRLIPLADRKPTTVKRCVWLLNMVTPNA